MRTAVVTGGSRGLGQRVVERLLSDGWRVACFSRSANDFVKKTAESAPESFFWQSADLLDTDSLRSFVAAAEQRFGRLDLLVNNAAILHQGLLLTMPPRQIEESVAANLVAPMTLTQALRPVHGADRRRSGGEHFIRQLRPGLPRSVGVRRRQERARWIQPEPGP
ncbi:SDR family NAD(P)-dependent oxidoreductase [Streptomyces sp. CA-132043]|uniref:SDR family NAD(P)-dependent oxidoreductase n=1 Tax=Streptomyces sp. CA-132043 TaxID=3240048 RepID=UPI003D8A1006